MNKTTFIFPVLIRRYLTGEVIDAKDLSQGEFAALMEENAYYAPRSSGPLPTRGGRLFYSERGPEVQEDGQVRVLNL